MIVGSSRPTGDQMNVTANRVLLGRRAGDAPFPAGARVGTVLAYMDGLGSGSGQQSIRGVCRDASGAYACTSPVVIPSGMTARWVHFRFATPPEPDHLAQANYGIWAGPGNVARVSFATGSGDITSIPSTYSDTGSPSDANGSSNTQGVLATCAYFEPPYVVPDLPDIDTAALPTDVAQSVFRATFAPDLIVRTARAAWHGVTTDDTPGSVAIVRSDGPLGDLLGERLLLTSRRTGAQVAVYVHDAEEFDEGATDEDISLTRAAYMPLGPLSADHIDVTVQVLL